MIDETMLITMLAHQSFSLASITIFVLIAIIQCGKKKASNAAVAGGQPVAVPTILPPMDEQKTQSMVDEGEGEKKKEEEEKKETEKETQDKKESKKESSKKEDSKKEGSKKEVKNTAVTQQSDQKIINEMKVMPTQEVHVGEEGEKEGEKKEDEKEEEKEEAEEKKEKKAEEDKKEGETDKKEDKKENDSEKKEEGESETKK